MGKVSSNASTSSILRVTKEFRQKVHAPWPLVSITDAILTKTVQDLSPDHMVRMPLLSSHVNKSSGYHTQTDGVIELLRWVETYAETLKYIPQFDALLNSLQAEIVRLRTEYQCAISVLCLWAHFTSWASPTFQKVQGWQATPFGKRKVSSERGGDIWVEASPIDEHLWIQIFSKTNNDFVKPEERALLERFTRLEPGQTSNESPKKLFGDKRSPRQLLIDIMRFEFEDKILEIQSERARHAIEEITRLIEGFNHDRQGLLDTASETATRMAEEAALLKQEKAEKAKISRKAKAEAKALERVEAKRIKEEEERIAVELEQARAVLLAEERVLQAQSFVRERAAALSAAISVYELGWRRCEYVDVSGIGSILPRGSALLVMFTQEPSPEQISDLLAVAGAGREIALASALEGGRLPELPSLLLAKCIKSKGDQSAIALEALGEMAPGELFQVGLSFGSALLQQANFVRVSVLESAPLSPVQVVVADEPVTVKHAKKIASLVAQGAKIAIVTNAQLSRECADWIPNDVQIIRAEMPPSGGVSLREWEREWSSTTYTVHLEKGSWGCLLADKGDENGFLNVHRLYLANEEGSVGSAFSLDGARAAERGEQLTFLAQVKNFSHANAQQTQAYLDGSDNLLWPVDRDSSFDFLDWIWSQDATQGEWYASCRWGEINYKYDGCDRHWLATSWEALRSVPVDYFLPAQRFPDCAISYPFLKEGDLKTVELKVSHSLGWPENHLTIRQTLFASECVSEKDKVVIRVGIPIGLPTSDFLKVRRIDHPSDDVEGFDLTEYLLSWLLSKSLLLTLNQASVNTWASNPSEYMQVLQDLTLPDPTDYFLKVAKRKFTSDGKFSFFAPNPWITIAPFGSYVDPVEGPRVCLYMGFEYRPGKRPNQWPDQWPAEYVTDALIHMSNIVRKNEAFAKALGIIPLH